MSPRMMAYPKGRRAPGARQAVVLVHGYGSTCSTNFSELAHELVTLDTASKFNLYCVDYDTNAGLEALGERLGELLQKLETEHDRIAVLGYSMGGLVSRMALMLTDLPKTTRLVTLASPNQGVFSSAQLNHFTQMLANSGMGTYFLRRHAEGVDDMRTAYLCFQGVRERVTTVGLNRRLTGKTYITIPANFFHEDRPKGSRAPSDVMRGAGFGFKVANVISGFLAGDEAVSLPPENDGLVMLERSRMLPPVGGSNSETESVWPPPEPPDWNLVALKATACNEVDHVSILRCEKIARLVYEALLCQHPNDVVAALHKANIEARIDED